MDFEMIRCSEGQRWFPWNYRRRSPECRVGMRLFAREPGLVVLNAIGSTPTSTMRRASYSFGTSVTNHADCATSAHLFRRSTSRQCKSQVLMETPGIEPGSAVAYEWLLRA
jgi:hypothetical protein